MKYYLFLLLLVVIYHSCIERRPKSGIEYIKAMAFGHADTVTLYNKGITMETYAYYNLRSDSLFYVTKEGDCNPLPEAFTSTLSGTAYRDSFLYIVDALLKRKKGNIIDTTYHYCNQPIYVEYKIGDSIYYHYYLDTNDTLNSFGQLFSGFFLRPVRKKTIDIETMNFEDESVNAMKNVGEYAKMEEPYIPVKCSDYIDLKQIYGSWRTINKRFSYKDRFMKLTFTNKGICFFENIKNYKTWKKYPIAKFRLVPQQNSINTNTNGEINNIKILKLTDHCLVIELNNKIQEFNRL